MSLTVNYTITKPAGVQWFQIIDPVTVARIREFDKTNSVGCKSRLSGPALDDDNVFYVQEIWETIEAHDLHMYKRINNPDFAVQTAYNKGKGIQVEKLYTLELEDGTYVTGQAMGKTMDQLAGSGFKKPLSWLTPAVQEALAQQENSTPTE